VMTRTTPMTVVALAATATLAGVSLVAQAPTPAADLLARHYRDGETLSYLMKTSNRGRTNTLTYTIAADVVVKKDAEGRFFEEIAWHDMAVDGAPFALPASSQAFRQRLTLEANPKYAQVPDLSKVHPMLIGPITDLLTFYADLLVAHGAGLTKAGDHFHLAHGTPASWADGQHVVIGEDSIDFDVTLKGIDRAAGSATLLVRHVPSTPPQIRIPAEWMRPPVADTPNNWVQVERTAANTFTAGIGQETFDATITLSLVDGRVLAATLENPVQVLERECKDAALTQCGSSARYEIRRHVEITSMR
jgi:hypothetical protein